MEEEIKSPVDKRGCETQFFHRRANYNKRNNYVETLEIGDRLVEGNEQRRKEMRDFFGKLYQEDVV